MTRARLVYCIRSAPPCRHWDCSRSRPHPCSMQRRHVLVVLLALVLTASLSAFVAYRLGVKRSSVPSARASGSGSACEQIQDAGTHLGEDGCVTGRVLRVYVSHNGNAFLDFCSNYRECPFTSVIFASDLNKFGDVSTLTGRQVEIRGRLKSYRGQPEIVIQDPQQLRVLDR
jgi:hypothetical protein